MPRSVEAPLSVAVPYFSAKTGSDVIGIRRHLTVTVGEQADSNESTADPKRILFNTQTTPPKTIPAQQKTYNCSAKRIRPSSPTQQRKLYTALFCSGFSRKPPVAT
ncbi:hypothetical protein [Aliiruegeria lutimaris]|uniref:hypothetical protein n=1 Tax=Aliiruegeria lutimaris TaxID=571298 RepID=UPI001113B451|nr:hypothetical protein [Aliiruegeria lutimaris]